MPGSSKTRRLRSQSRAVEALKGYNQSPEWPRSASKSKASSQKSVVSVVRAPDRSKSSSRSRSPHSHRRRSSSRTSEVRRKQSSEPETHRWVKDFRKTMVGMQKANSKRLEHLKAELRKANKKNKKEECKMAYKFTKKWNEEQYEFNQEIYHKGPFIIYRDNRGRENSTGIFLDFRGPFSKSSKPVPVTIIFFQDPSGTNADFFS